MEVTMTQKYRNREHLEKQGKFRVGDLVQLSYYGRNSSQNESEKFDGNEMGYVSGISGMHEKYPIEVTWINIDSSNVATRFFFRELKLFRT